MTDNSGAVVANATVTATQTDQNVAVRTVTTDQTGHYSLPQLPIGHYKVSVVAKGFKATDISNITLNVNDRLSYNTVLQVGANTEAVTVTADAQQVQLSDSTAASLITGTQVRELSLNNRNYEQLVNLMPGVAYGAGDQLYVGTTNPNGQTNTVSFSINGQRNSANNWTVDGADNVDRGSNLTLLTYPSVDAISEFKVLRGLYNPEFGRAAGGQINVVTKSGTNAFHGGAYEFFRNDVLQANNYFNNLNGVKRPPLRYNDFGYTIGGPIFKNKTFFFFSEEWNKTITYGTASALVPTDAQKQGTFAHPVCLDVRPAGSTAACTTTGTQVTTINPVAAAYISSIWSKIPAPQSGNSLVVPLRSIFDHRQELVRIDHTFNSKASIYGRFTNDSIPTQEPGGLFTNAALPGVATTSTNSPGRGVTIGTTYAFNPTFLLDGGYSFSYGAIISDPIGLISSKVSNISTTLPFASTLDRVPAVSISGASGIAGFGQYRDYNRNHNAFGNVTKVLGRHTMRFGASYNHYQKTENASGNNAGSFSFISTGKPAAASTFEQSWANFLLGNVGTFTQADQDLTPDMNAQQFEWYGQDEWHMRPNLTLTFGMRYSYFGQPVDHNNLLTNFDPAAYNPANAPQLDASGNIVAGTGDPLNGIIINGKGSPFGEKVSSQNKSNFAPRIGIAWDPFGDGKTSIRSGYGMFFDSTLVGIFEQNIFANPPFVNNISIPNTRFEDPTAGVPSVSLVPKALHGTVVNDKTPNTQQWSLDVQRQITRSTIVDVGYYGSKSTHLLGIIDINQPVPGSYVGVVTATGANGFIAGGDINKLNPLRPYLGYSSINSVLPGFDANYNSLQVSVQKRFSGDSSIGVNYTWSRALTDAQTDRNSAPQNSRDLAADYGRSQLDRTHIFNANFVYELPWMRDQKGFAGHVLGGWELSGIVAANTGLPLTILSGANIDPAGLGCKSSPSACSTRPDLSGDPNGPKTILEWFNTAAFTEVPAGQFRPGNERRGVVSGPGFWRVDFSTFKNIKITERLGMQFRAEAFNLFNHTNFDGVRTTTTLGNFGQVFSARDPRIVQLGLKLNF